MDGSPGGDTALGSRDVDRLVVGQVGRVVRCESTPGVQLLDAAGVPVVAVDEFLRSLAASDSPATTLYSYASALLRWWRFLAAIDVGWDRACRVEVRDFVLWLRGSRRHGSTVGFAPATINHNLAVLGSFYDERMAAGVGPVINPVPGVTADGQRRYAHHNPMEPFRRGPRAPLRQKVPQVGLKLPPCPRNRGNFIVRSDGLRPGSGVVGVLCEHRRSGVGTARVEYRQG